MKKQYQKTIKLFLLDGEPNGRVVCEISNWTGKAYRIPRGKVKDCVNREDLAKTGVYILLGGRDMEGEKPKAYIGEAENIFQRLKQHLGEKEFWNEAVVFLSKDENLNKAHIKYLEARLFSAAQNANRFNLTNGNKPPQPSLSESDQAEMEEFSDYIRLLTSTLGYRVFEPVLDQSGNVEETSDQLFTLGQRQSEAEARGKRSPDGFVVLKGSTIKKTVSNSYPTGYFRLRKRLKEKGIIQDRNGSWVFSEDYLFSSPSTASSIVLGRSSNGLNEWKNSSGKKLKEVEKEEVSGVCSD
jgi:hypothetical protein